MSDRYSVQKELLHSTPNSLLASIKLSGKITKALAKTYILFRWKRILSILKQASRFFSWNELGERYYKKHCKFTVDEGFGTSYVLLQEECEDRPFSLYTSQMTDETKQEENLPSSCLVEEEENEKYFGPPTFSFPSRVTTCWSLLHATY